VQKADLQPASAESPDRVAVDQKAIRINDEQYWLYAAVDPGTNRILHCRLFPTYTVPITREFLTELAEKHDVSLTPCFSSMTLTTSSVVFAEKATATASNNMASETRLDVSFAR
jgi:transposase-like protein